MPRPNVVEKILRACRVDTTLSGGGVAVVAFSGGPDSTALLHALSCARRRLGLELVAAHLDHGLHARSARDAKMAAAFCAEHRVQLVSRRIKLPARARGEDGARRARYSFLEDVAREVGTATVALGHTADDQAETVLMHLIRGSGLEGISAMAVREGLRFRPMLGIWRSDVEEYCLRQGLRPLQDPSNHDVRILRNRVRLELLPAMARVNPKVKASLIRLADAARAEHDVVIQVAREWCTTSRRGSKYPRASFRELPPAIQVQVFREIWAQVAGEIPGGSARLKQAVELVRRPRASGMMQLGSELTLLVTNDVFLIRAEYGHATIGQ
jgi:tRNA(Ile)-lysidine synthase